MIDKNDSLRDNSTIMRKRNYRHALIRRVDKHIRYLFVLK